MSFLSHKKQHPKGSLNLSDHFAIKNFILKEFNAIQGGQSFEESFFFDGVVCVLCLKGEADFKVNYREHHIKKNSVLTLLPGQIFRLTKQSPDLVVESLLISSDYVLRLPIPKDFNLLKRMGYSPVKQVTVACIENLLELHSLIAKHNQNEDSTFRDLQVRSLVFALLMELATAYDSPETTIPTEISRQEQLTETFFALLFEHRAKERSVGFYADKMCLTPKYLSMTVKTVTGHSILSWINEAVVIEAKRLLKVSDKTVLQISEELNFPNPSFFGNFFKRHTGLTPMQYKKS